MDDRFSIGVQGDVVGLHVKGSQSLKAVSELVEEVCLVNYGARLSIWMARGFAGPLLRFVWCVFFRVGVLVFFEGF